MRNPMKTIAAFAALGSALAVVASLSLPADSVAFEVSGEDLGPGQRDFRTFNNFGDPTANNNTTPHVNFPGALGATMAIWKGHVEWSSGFYAGDGEGDITQTALGTGGANFDNTYQGEANNAGNFDANIHSEQIDETPGSTLAFTVTPISNGWTIRYLSGWTWHDGPGSVPSGSDIQGIACHEVGHSLGLNHSGVSSATMFFAASGSGQSGRSINFDDVDGIQAIYGVKSGSKPEITGIGGSMNIGGTLIISGSDFLPADPVSVWFTKTNSDGVPEKINTVSTGGGTSISVVIPATAETGEILIKTASAGGESMSNAWPITILPAISDPPTLTNVNPGTGPEGGFTEVTLTGSGFNGTTSVTFDAVEALDFSVDSPTQITATTPPGSVGAVDVTVTDPDGSDTLTNGFTYTVNPAPDISNVVRSSGPASGGTMVTVSGPNVLGVTSVEFDGDAGNNLQIVSATELTVDTPGGIGVVDVEAIGNGSDTLAGGFTYTDVGAFVDTGFSLAGSMGAPVFTGAGDLTPGSSVGYFTLCSNAIPFITGFLFIGVQAGAQPFKGGTLYPFPFIKFFGIPFNASGQRKLVHAIDPGPGGFSIMVQWWFQDASGPVGFTASNGQRLDVP